MTDNRFYEADIQELILNKNVFLETSGKVLLYLRKQL